MLKEYLRIWDLKKIINALLKKADSIEEVYIFGSRARRTNSYRSDIDLLIYTPRALASVNFAPWINRKYNPVDLFETNDHKNARSLVNGSSIVSDEGTVESKLDAVLLWSKDKNYNDSFNEWIQKTVLNANFAMTILPIMPGDITSTARRFAGELLEAGLPNTNIGAGWREIGQRIAEIVEAALDARFKLRTNDSNITSDSIEIANEYDFQNFIYLVLKPWLPTLEAEPYIVKFDGQKKHADFAIEGNSLVIEAKHIRDSSTKAAVLKTLEGLRNFYQVNPNLKSLLFLILVDQDVDIDAHLIRSQFSRIDDDPPIIVDVLKNKNI